MRCSARFHCICRVACDCSLLSLLMSKALTLRSQQCLGEAEMSSGFAEWALRELQQFSALFIRQVYTTDDLTVISKCIDCCLQQRRQLRQLVLPEGILTESLTKPIGGVVQSYISRVKARARTHSTSLPLSYSYSPLFLFYRGAAKLQQAARQRLVDIAGAVAAGEEWHGEDRPHHQQLQVHVFGVAALCPRYTRLSTWACV